MTYDLIQAAWRGLVSSTSSLFEIGLIVIPLMIGMEMARDTGLTEKVTGWLRPLARPFGMSPAAVFPVLIGAAFGLSYGSGVIIQTAKTGDLSSTDRQAVALFLCVSHSLIEDTLILLAVGANAAYLIPVRVLLPVAVTLMAAKFVLPTAPGRCRSRPQNL